MKWILFAILSVLAIQTVDHCDRPGCPHVYMT